MTVVVLESQLKNGAKVINCEHLIRYRYVEISALYNQNNLEYYILFNIERTNFMSLAYFNKVYVVSVESL